MAEENVSILRVDTGEAVKSVNDLKENIKLLKGSLGDLEIGSQAYQDTLDELKVNQNALKDAMYATTGTMKDVAAAATGASKSYNSLVHQMAALKEEWRATNDIARRNELGQQIAEINAQLKEMDASVGNFSRNVGNYESGVVPLVEKFDQFGGILKQMPPTLGAAKEQIGKVGETMQLVGKQPILGIIGLLAPIIIKITAALQQNQTAMDAVKKMMTSLEPIMKLFEMALERIAQVVAKVAEWMGKMIGKVTERFVQIKDEAEGIGDAVTEGIEEATPNAVKAAEDMGQQMAEAIEDQIKMIDWEKALKEGLSKRAAVAKAMEAQTKEANDLFNEMMKEESAELEKFLEEEVELYGETLMKEKKMEEEKLKARMDTMTAVASATSSLISSLADIMESDEKNSEKNAQKIKALRIASATIDMLNGAVMAYASAQSLGPIAGPIVGGINAGAVVAMGIANINKIKSTNPGSGGSASSVTPASVEAPNVETNLATTRNITTASEEERLNRMASSQRVYILQSDIEAANNQSKAQVEESSF